MSDTLESRAREFAEREWNEGYGHRDGWTRGTAALLVAFARAELDRVWEHADDLALLVDRLISHAHAVHHDEAEVILRLGGKPPRNISIDVEAAKAGLAAYHALKEPTP